MAALLFLLLNKVRERIAARTYIQYVERPGCLLKR